MALVMPAIGLVLFLSALDQTIVATALPTIAADLNASPSDYSWVGTSYLLAMTLMTPFNGRVSDIVGRKPVMFAAIIVFTVASALCGAAKTIEWMIACRAIQGLGGGTIIGMTNIVIGDIVPLEQRGAYQGYIGATWGIASVLGPIIGGALATKASWRWCFYINLPTCGAAFAMLFFTLKLNQTKKYTFKTLRDTFDFLGL
jgi:multidrug resistance protein